jgi:hypothetical protein
MKTSQTTSEAIPATLYECDTVTVRRQSYGNSAEQPCLSQQEFGFGLRIRSLNISANLHAVLLGSSGNS